MKKDKSQFSRRELFKGAAHAGLASVLIPLTGASADSPDHRQISDKAQIIDFPDLNAAAVIYTPSIIYSSEGVQTNIYFDNVVFSNLPNELLAIDVVCSKGRQYDKFWRISPQPADEGTTSFKIEVSFAGKLITSKTSELIITGKSKGSGKSIKVLCIGDSTTAGGNYISIINTDYQSLASPSMTFLGTRGTAPNKHEGRGGWKFSQYAGASAIPSTNSATTLENPFWNLKTQRLDFKKYMTDHGYTMTPDDLITVHLGINDVFWENSQAKLDSIKADLNKMIAEFRAVIPQINIGLCITIPPSISQDAFAISYASGQTLKRYMENYKQLVDFLLTNYDTPEMRASRIYCIGFNYSIDRTNNFQKTTMKANARSTQIIETWGNGVHPDNSGYYQMGDALYAFIKSLRP